jgi:periplasmic divalent cation tolerance protein
MSISDQVLTVTTTVGTLEQASGLARRILDSRLAACVQVDSSLTSFYRWEGKLCEDPEVRLVIKTLPECREALLALFAEHHPYDVPQFVATPGQASAAYAHWVRSEVRVPSA